MKKINWTKAELERYRGDVAVCKICGWLVSHPHPKMRYCPNCSYVYPKTDNKMARR